MALTRLNSTRDFFRIWFYWKYQALASFCIIVGIVMAFAYLYTPDYTATAKILILPRTGEGEIISSGSVDDRIAEVSLQGINSEIELLNSEDVLRETVQSFMDQGESFELSQPAQSIADKVIDATKQLIGNTLILLGLKDKVSPFDAKVLLLQNSIEVETVAMSNVILVSLKAERPRLAAVVLNRLLDVYIRHHTDVYSKDEGIEFYDDQAADYRLKLELKEKELKEFQKQWHIVDLQVQNKANIDQIGKMKSELQQNEVNCSEIEQNIAMLRVGLKGDLNITREMRTIPAIIELEKGLVPLYIKRSDVLKNYTKTSREYQNVNSQIATLQGEIRNEVKKAVQTESLELMSLQARQASLRTKIAELQGEADFLNQKERELDELQRQTDLLTKNYMLYSSKAEDARIYAEKKKRDLTNVSIADRADIPVKPSFPKKPLLLIISMFVGLFAAMGTPFILEFLDHRIKNASDVEDLLSLPVISSIPYVKS